MSAQITLHEGNGKPLIELKDNGPTFMQLLAVAVEKQSAIDVIERLAALQEKAMAQRALLEFNEALNRVQTEIKRVGPDLDNPQTHSKYASYAAIDRAIRPIYSREGFSLSFTHADCPKADHIRVICRVSRGAHIELYQINMPSDGKGAKGGDVMTKTHATAAADSYAKRYLVKDIFNIAIGEDDVDGNDVGGNVSSGKMADLREKIEYLQNCRNIDELRKYFKEYHEEACKLGDIEARRALIKVGNAKKAEFLSR